MRIVEGRQPPTTLSPKFPDEQLAAMHRAYVEDGVAVVRGLLPLDWVDALTAVIADVRALDAAGLDLGEAEVRNFPGKATIRWLWREYDIARRFFTEAGVQHTVAAVIGATKIQYWFDNTFIHEHGKDAQGSQWHHDIAAFPFAGTQIPSVWIALTDVPLNMAPLQMIRGSQRNPVQFRPPVYIDPGLPVPEGYAEMPDVDARIASGEFEVIQCPMKRGDAFIVHPYTLHGSPPSEVDGMTRIAFTTRWAGDDVVWKPDAFSMSIDGVDFARVPIGMRPSGEGFPYAPLNA